MSVAHRINEAEYEQIVLGDPVHIWELVNGQVRERPGMSWEHGRAMMHLVRLLLPQLDYRQFELRMNEGRVSRPPGSVYIPDLIVVPATLGEVLGGRPGRLAMISDPLPLIVEVWSRSTGDYDVDARLPMYMERGDMEIWRIHPYERTLTAWIRQSDGSYKQTVHRDGTVRPTALPGVEITLDDVFDV